MKFAFASVTLRNSASSGRFNFFFFSELEKRSFNVKRKKKSGTRQREKSFLIEPVTTEASLVIEGL